MLCVLQIRVDGSHKALLSLTITTMKTMTTCYILYPHFIFMNICGYNKKKTTKNDTQNERTESPNLLGVLFL